MEVEDDFEFFENTQQDATEIKAKRTSGIIVIY